MEFSHAALKNVEYNRTAAVEYALKWALSRNPRYYDFDSIGGDCTNFVSQSLYSGAKVMNYTPELGWYYNSLNDRAPAWSSVKYLHKFLISNKGAGPYGIETDRSKVLPGDIVQMAIEGEEFGHSAVIDKIENGKIYVSAHTYDSRNRPLSSYSYSKIRFIHILGVRKWG
ncbi:MAG: amidase [Oscillospiraceae bacterium]|jgi:hypothetical protein|nr:amidase [Oscillospiraceae bacterium]